MCQEGVTPQLLGAEALVLRALLDLTLHTSLSGCSSLSFIISFTQATQGEVFP